MKLYMRTSSIPLPEISEIDTVGGAESAGGVITKKGFEHFRAGIITGIHATLLNEGSLTDLDVVILLIKTSTDNTAFRAAAPF